MLKDISFLKTGYGELISSIRLFDKEIAEQKKKVKELELNRQAEMRKLKIKIKEELFRAIESDEVRSFLALPVYSANDMHTEMIIKGDILGNLHEVRVEEKEVRVGDIWGASENHFMYIKIEDLKVLGLNPTETGLRSILTKVALASDRKMIIELSNVLRKNEGFILLKGYNLFTGKINIE